MNIKRYLAEISFPLICLGASVAYGDSAAQTASRILGASGTVDAGKLAGIALGTSTRRQVEALLGVPWRVVQFNDCGMAMPNQADETWEYRGKDENGTYRLHIEFDDLNLVHLIARIPDTVPGGGGTSAKVFAHVMGHNDRRYAPPN